MVIKGTGMEETSLKQGYCYNLNYGMNGVQVKFSSTYI